VFLLENVWLVGFERSVHDGKSVEAYPSLGEGFKAGVVRTTVLEFPEVSKMLGNLRFIFGEVDKCPDSTHLIEI
jgi:hypothetical protein